MSDVEDGYLSPPVQRAARLLRHIAEGDPVTNMARTARALEINRTTLLRLLHTLEAEHFIEVRPEGNGWRIGMGLIGMAAQAFFAEDLVQVTMPVATRLAEALNLACHMGVLDGREVVYVARRAPNHALVSNVRVGSRLPAHAAVMGRIILAGLPPEKVRRLYEGVVLTASTRHTPVTLVQLQAMLAADRAIGLAWSDEFYEAGISAVAASIHDASGQPVAALNVSGPHTAFVDAARRRAIGEALQQAALEISHRLGWSGSREAVNA